MPHITKVRLNTPPHIRQIREDLAKRRFVPEHVKQLQSLQEQSYKKDLPVDTSRIREDEERTKHFLDDVVVPDNYENTMVKKAPPALVEHKQPSKANTTKLLFKYRWRDLKTALRLRDVYGAGLIDMDAFHTCVRESGAVIPADVLDHFLSKCITEETGERMVKYRKWYRMAHEAELKRVNFLIEKGVEEKFGSKPLPQFRKSPLELQLKDGERCKRLHEDKKKLAPLGESWTMQPWATLTDAKAPISDMVVHDNVKKRLRWTLAKHEKNLGMEPGCVPRHIFVQVLATIGYSSEQINKVLRLFTIDSSGRLVHYEKFLSHIKADKGVRRMELLRPVSVMRAEKEELEEKMMSLRHTTILPAGFTKDGDDTKEDPRAPFEQGRTYHCMYCGEYKDKSKFDAVAVRRKKHMCIRCSMTARWNDGNSTPRAQKRYRPAIRASRRKPEYHTNVGVPQFPGRANPVPAAQVKTWTNQKTFLTAQYTADPRPHG